MLRTIIAALFVLLCRPAAAEVISLSDLQLFMDEHYPRTTTGQTQVTLAQPRVYRAGDKRVIVRFSATAMTADRSSRFDGITASFEGELVRGRDRLFVQNMEPIKVDAESVGYLYRDVVVNTIQGAILKDYIAEPILRILDEKDSYTWLFDFGAKPLRVVD